jgi:predicted TIM-barrel fold metal-dependent hydrolase
MGSPDIAKGNFTRWAQSMDLLSKEPNVVVKVR